MKCTRNTSNDVALVFLLLTLHILLVYSIEFEYINMPAEQNLLKKVFLKIVVL